MDIPPVGQKSTTTRKLLSFILVFSVMMLVFMAFDGLLTAKVKSDIAVAEAQSVQDEARQQRQYDRAMALVKAAQDVNR